MEAESGPSVRESHPFGPARGSWTSAAAVTTGKEFHLFPKTKEEDPHPLCGIGETLPLS